MTKLSARQLFGDEIGFMSVADGSAAPVGDREMQPFTFELVRVGI